ncbi:MAG: valine--tRNA ligase, partial [Actinobacteria bacterium]|nr:valine--tRNA ligase [Actinomycetota bacterium]
HIDRWILDRLDETISQTDALFESFEFAKGCDAIYRFAWDEVCDWYLELIKDSFAAGGKAADQTRRVLGNVLDQLLRIMHPVMPFLSEALWTSLTKEESLVIASWPKVTPEFKGEKEPAEVVAGIQRLITEIRRFRNEQGIKTSARIPAKITGLKGPIAHYESSIRFLVRLDEPGSDFAAGAKVEIDEYEVHFDLRGSIDVKAERARLSKDLVTITKDRETARVKLENENFMAKAPMDVVTEIRQRFEFCDAEIERINAQLAALPQE